MPPYEEIQNRAMEEFAALARHAQNARRMANRATPTDILTHGREHDAAGKAAEKLADYSTELLGREVVKQRGDDLASDVRDGLMRVGEVLDRHVGAGPALSQQRVALLNSVDEHTKAHRDDTSPDYEEVAMQLNLAQAGGVLQLRGRPVARTVVRQPFRAADAERLVTELKGLRSVLEGHARQLTSVFGADQQRDSIFRTWSRSTSTTLSEGSDDLPTPPPHTASQVPDTRMSSRTLSLGAIPDGPVATPVPAAASSLLPAARGVKRKATEPLGRHSASRGAPFTIYEDGPEIHAAAETHGHSFTTAGQQRIESLRALKDQENHGPRFESDPDPSTRRQHQPEAGNRSQPLRSRSQSRDGI